MPVPAVAAAAAKTAAAAAKTTAAAAKTVTAKAAKEIPRGALVRAAKEISRAEESNAQQPGISLPIFLFILHLAAAADLIDLIEVIPKVGILIGLVFGKLFGVILLLTYWGVGARSVLPIATAIIGTILELMPGISMLPINTLTALIVYMIMNPPQIIKRMMGAAGVFAGGSKIAPKAAQTIGAVAKTVPRIA